MSLPRLVRRTRERPGRQATLTIQDVGMDPEESDEETNTIAQVNDLSSMSCHLVLGFKCRRGTLGLMHDDASFPSTTYMQTSSAFKGGYRRLAALHVAATPYSTYYCNY